MTTWLLIVWSTAGAFGPVELQHYELPNRQACEVNRKQEVSRLKRDMGNLSIGAQCVPLKERGIPKVG